MTHFKTSRYLGGLAWVTAAVVALLSAACGDTDPIPAAAPGPHIAWIDTLSNASSDSPAVAGLETDLDSLMRANNLRGISVAVMRNDSLLYAKGLGFANAEDSVDMEVTTACRLASTSKLVTAVAIFRLVEQGRLSLDSKLFGPDGLLNDIVPADELGDPRAADITVAHLLRHEGGFSRYKIDPMFSTEKIIEKYHLAEPPTPAHLARLIMSERLDFAPGTDSQYSNFGYMLLSLAIEKASGMTYADYVNSQVAAPAGCAPLVMTSNYPDGRDSTESRHYTYAPELVNEYTGSRRLVSRAYGGSDLEALLGAGAWSSSAVNICRLVAAIDGVRGVADILSPQSVKHMTQQSMGWKYTDGDTWVRTGTVGSAHSMVIKFPDNECWVIVTNTGVRRGWRFSDDLAVVIDTLRKRHSATLPRRDLFNPGRSRLATMAIRALP